MMANALIKAAPRIAEIRDSRKQQITIRLAYRISRALIGNELANALQYPNQRTLGVLFRYRAMQRVNRLVKSDGEITSDNVSLLKKLSEYDEDGLSYRLPDHAKHPLSSEW